MPITRLLLLVFLLLSSALKAQVANRFDVVITEIMADPSPPVGLPNAEYIEIKNISATAFNLTGWRLSDANSTAIITDNIVLQPDSFLILCANSNATAFSAYGRTVGLTGFPSLDNDGDQLILRSKEGRIIHALAYTVDWYQNEIKKNGGWSLEIKDPQNPCSGMSNWKASIDAGGGTPGKKNSVDGANNDQTPPQLIRTYSPDSVTIIAVFNEPLDSLSASAANNYSLPRFTIVSATPQTPLFNQVSLKLSSALQKRVVYTLTVANVKDCRNNFIGSFNTAKLGWAEEAMPADIVINEILFNPKPNGFDYVEIYNNSNKILDAGKLFIANRNSTGAISSVKKLSEAPFCIFPGDYIVATEDAGDLKKNYLVKNPNNILILSSLPSYPDDKGNIVVTNFQGNVVDEVSYSEKWHFALIGDAEGIALERIDPSAASQDAGNWHSAASTAGYGTPTYKNSQYKQTAGGNAIIEVNPKTFSPDNDGHDDITTIYYQVSEPGYVANISIFDAGGRRVRYFAKNALLGLKGSWNWDGLDEKNQKLPVGIYIIYTEIFSLQGKKKQFKNTIVLAGKLN